MNTFQVAFKAQYLLYFSLFTRSVFSNEGWRSRICPHHQGSDPSDVNERIKKLASQDVYYTEDTDYKYKISICAENSEENRAVQQHGFKWPDGKWTTVGRYKGAHVTGGTNWLMIKYFHGDKYNHHCSGVERIAVLLINCDPGEQRGSVKVIEEYRNKSTFDNPFECYFLFELNHDAACTVKPKSLSPEVKSTHSSPWFIALIVLVVLETIYIILGFIYQRYVARVKGLEQCGGFSFTRCCQGNHKTADDTITDVDVNNFDDALPVVL